MGIKISNLPELTSVSSTNIIPIVSEGVTQKIKQDNLIPDATDLVKGKAITVEATITAAAEATTPVDADLFSVIVSSVLKKLTWANLKATLKTYFDTLYAPISSTSDGWSAVSSWTYASANTITVASGAAAIYRVGDKIKWTQTTVKYGVIIAVADTLLTIAINTDYVVANAAITLPYYSHQETPIGFPSSFAYTPTGPTNTTLTGRFSVRGRTALCRIKGVLTGAPSFASMPTLPFAASANMESADYIPAGVGGYLDSGTANGMNGIIPSVGSSGTTCLLKSVAGAGGTISATVPITWATNDVWFVQFEYEI